MKPTNQALENQEQPLETASEFQSFLREQARIALMGLIKLEVEQLCGAFYRPEIESEYFRSGGVTGTVYVDGRRETIRRPRVRQRQPECGSEEVTLVSWQLASDPEQWQDAIMRAVLCGVSTRKIESLQQSDVRGMSKSNISRLWQAKASALVDEMQSSDLSGFDLLVMMIDAVVLTSGLVATVALGIDPKGDKQVLGFRVGSSENEEVCADLLSHLLQRGLRVDEGRRLLAVLDGSKALKKALRRIWPDALIQRCLVHKERNLRGYLPAKHHGRLAQLFNALRKSQGSEAAHEALKALTDFLADKNAQARESLEEARGEMLTLLELNVPNTLNRSLLSTNAIENVFKNLRRHIGRVCRWRKQTQQANQWLASGLTLASQGFRKISGHRDLHHLQHALANETIQAKG